MTRTIQFPVTYRISGRLHGRQQARTYLFAESAEASITDVSAEDAPVAVSWKVPVVRDSRITPWDQRQMWAFDADRQQHIRHYDGRHWLRVLSEPRYIDSPVEPISASEFAASAHTGRFNGCLGFAGETKMRKLELVTYEPLDRFDDIDECSKRYAALRAEGLEFISVDDVLYVRCEQPCFKLLPVEVSSGRIRHVPILDAVWNGEKRPIDKTRIAPLPLSMREEVIRRCGSTDPFSPVGAGGDVEWPLVHLPDSMSTDYDLELEADYLVQEFRANYRDHSYLEFYFRNRSAEDKLDHLLRGNREWDHIGSAADPIRRAIEALESISITLSPKQASSGPTPR